MEKYIGVCELEVCVCVHVCRYVCVHVCVFISLFLFGGGVMCSKGGVEKGWGGNVNILMN